MGSNFDNVDIAVLIPCRNESLSVAKVVADFRRHLPGAEIFVYDNNSVDDTAARAEAAGAVVRREERPGKGNVVRRMFTDTESDIYVMVDGDDTYDAGAAPEMVRRLLEEQRDMVVGTRRGQHRRYHEFGNRLFNFTYACLIGSGFSDIFSGFRVFSRRFVKSFPAISNGFEVETEMSVHAMLLSMPVAEVATEYRQRTQGSFSKLHTFRDASRILKTILYLFKEVRPFVFFGTLSVVFAGISFAFAVPLLQTYLNTGLVPRFPTAILSTGLMLMAGLSLGCGLILDSVAHGRLEQKRILYLGIRNQKER